MEKATKQFKLGPHTPGPWDIIEDSRNGEELFLITYNEHGNWLAEVFLDGDVPNPQGKADAHLIAAAPELLAALKKLTAETQAYDGTGARMERLLEAERDALAAIAKATEGKF